MAHEYDVVVIGAGTGGYVAAIRAAQLGLKTAVVEKEKSLGGTCLNWGCIPTKALQVHARKDRIVTGLTKGVEFLFKKNKIDWIKGTARLTRAGASASPLTVDVFEGDKQTLVARKDVIVATGSSPRSVPGVEIDHKRIITSDEAIHLKDVPKALVIMGCGAVGVEFASIFNRFGSDVTLLE